MIKLILSIAVIAMIFSGCVGIEDPITKGQSMQINHDKQGYTIKNAKNINYKVNN